MRTRPDTIVNSYRSRKNQVIGMVDSSKMQVMCKISVFYKLKQTKSYKIVQNRTKSYKIVQKI